jgi:hypothetical protein
MTVTARHLCVLLQASLSVRVNMNQSNSGQSLSHHNSSLATFSYSAQIAASEQEAVAVSKKIPFPSAQLDKIYHRQRALRAQAAKDFAALNNWQVSLTPFPLFALTPRHSVQPAITNYRQILFGDHPPVLFRENSPPHQPVAIVGQPRHANPDAVRAVATKLGLKLHLPANITASWWHPGEAAFFCFTRPGTKVKFLPEQTELPTAFASPEEEVPTLERQTSFAALKPKEVPAPSRPTPLPPPLSFPLHTASAASPPPPPHASKDALVANVTNVSPPAPRPGKRSDHHSYRVTLAEIRAHREQVRMIGIMLGNWRETARTCGLKESRVLNWVVRYGWKLPARYRTAPPNALVWSPVVKN